MNKKPELVLPGGDLKRAKIAFDFGADAVYVGLNKHSLRKGEVRFDVKEIGKAIEYAHSKKKKLYVTFNIFAHNNQLKSIEADMGSIAKLNPDAFIVADVGVMQIAKRVAPKIPLHISTQANTTNIEDVKFWKSLGAKRVVLARELTLKEIAEIHKTVPNIELEVFAHGSMCMSYSGRCLLSNYMTGRHSNLGDCAQPCRWNYRLTQAPNAKQQIPNKSQKSKFKTYSKFENQNSKFFLEEKQRPGEFFEIEESENGTNIMSSKDLCTIEHVDKMIRSGITGFKVEGRNKTEYYLASTALAYREAINLSISNKYTSKDKVRLKNELLKNAHRDYTTGFLFGDAKKGETYEGRSPIQNWEYIGLVTSPSSLRGAKRRGNLDRHAIARDDNSYEVVVKNKIARGMSVEVLTPGGIKKDKILEILVDDIEVNEISAGTTDQTAIITLESSYSTNSLLRTEVK